MARAEISDTIYKNRMPFSLSSPSKMPPSWSKPEIKIVFHCSHQNPPDELSKHQNYKNSLRWSSRIHSDQTRLQFGERYEKLIIFAIQGQNPLKYFGWKVKQAESSKTCTFPKPNLPLNHQYIDKDRTFLYTKLKEK